jgi:hypothetical protein
MFHPTIRCLAIAGVVFTSLPSDPGTSVRGAEKDGSSFNLAPSFEDREIYDTYERLNRHGEPLFISTDLALHSAHLLFDYSLRAVESEHLFDQAKRLTEALLEASKFQDARSADAGPSVTGYLAVAAKLLDPNAEIPANVSEGVNKELALIAEHKGGAYSHVLDNVEDFSQYVPRGHYTRNEDFARYFRAMMWYGRRMFRVEETRPDSGPPPASMDHWTDEHRRREVQMMLKLTWMLYDAKIGDESAIDVWQRLYVPTVLFAGKTEDLTPEQVKSLAENQWKQLPPPAEIARLSAAELDRFAQSAAVLSRPKIDSSGMGRKGFCLMAQRFTPDSYITQTLVTDGSRPFGDVGHPLVYEGHRDPRPFTWGSNRYLKPPERRFMPRGLDVMAVLGSQEALKILTADGDTEYGGYVKLVAQLTREVSQLRQDRRDESVYYAWLDVLTALIPTPQESAVPEVFRSAAWTRKELMTGLASWTELRHDTILYVKQSYTPKPRSGPPAPAPVYVEPYPEVFARAGQLVARLRDRLQTLGVMPAALAENYDDYIKLMGELEQAAHEELAGRPLTPKAMASLRYSPARLKGVTRLPGPLAEKLLGKADSEMAVIADVHTDANAGQVLEEAVGRPMLLTVTLPSSDGPVSFQGAAFSYYEFKQPLNDRLTDESWQGRLSSPATRPKLPDWLPFVER